MGQVAHWVKHSTSIGKVPCSSSGLVIAFFPFLVYLGAHLTLGSGQEVVPKAEPGGFDSRQLHHGKKLKSVAD